VPIIPTRFLFGHNLTSDRENVHLSIAVLLVFLVVSSDPRPDARERLFDGVENSTCTLHSSQLRDICTTLVLLGKHVTQTLKRLFVNHQSCAKGFTGQHSHRKHGGLNTDPLLGNWIQGAADRNGIFTSSCRQQQLPARTTPSSPMIHSSSNPTSSLDPFALSLSQSPSSSSSGSSSPPSYRAKGGIQECGNNCFVRRWNSSRVQGKATTESELSGNEQRRHHVQGREGRANAVVGRGLRIFL
jgi:hypothetical protein